MEFVVVLFEGIKLFVKKLVVQNTIITGFQIIKSGKSYKEEWDKYFWKVLEIIGLINFLWF